jgi:hypothetical protein
MPWIYADEPTIGGIAHDPVEEFLWTPGLEKLFFARYGRSIEPFLSELTDTTRPQLSAEAAHVRVDYFDLLAHLLEVSYLEPIFKWCESHGVASGGHLLMEPVYLRSPVQPSDPAQRPVGPRHQYPEQPFHQPILFE